MVTLAEAVAAERSTRSRNREDALKRQKVGQALLQALAHRLSADPLPAWYFALDDHQIHICRIKKSGSQRRVASWTVDKELRLVLGQEMTEWITAESCNRVIDEAVQITARFIIDADEHIPRSRLAMSAERWWTFVRDFGARYTPRSLQQRDRGPR